MLNNLFYQEETVDTGIQNVVPITRSGTARIELADALERYKHWPAPTVIVSARAYGVSGFPGAPPTPESLANWYAPHIAAWSRYALPETTL